MAEAHMRRTISSRRRGRPWGSHPLFVEDCTRADATAMLAKSRGHNLDDNLAALPVTVSWTEYGQTHVRSLLLPVTTTVQRFGGVRRWWRCPKCGRRRRVLLMSSEGSAIAVACRRCLGAVYSADYPARHCWRETSALITGFLADGSIPGIERCKRELDVLLAKRRRGVRRGRRVLCRALRALVRLSKQPDTAGSLIRDYDGRRGPSVGVR